MPVGVLIASFNYTGTAQLNDVFGFYQAPSTVIVTGLQLSAQVAPAGGNITMELVDVNGDGYGREITLLAASTYKNQPLSALLTLAPGNAIRAKITEVDLGVAGYFTLNVIGATGQYPQGPCCAGPRWQYCGC